MTPLAKVIFEAEKERKAIGHFNVSNAEQLKAVIAVAQRLNTPVIIGLSEGEREFIGIHQVVALIESYRKNSQIPIFLNADHTHSLEKAKAAAEAGFDLIVFDGSKLPFEENMSKTREAVEVIKDIDEKILVEGELGYIGSGSEIRKELPEGAAIRAEDFTKPEEAVQFIKETGVDMLAPAVGNIHGIIARTSTGLTEIHTENPSLDTQRIKQIKEVVGVPLVLHGGSGIKREDFLAAIDAGISIIHISTELRVAWRGGLEKALKENPNELALYKIEGEAIAQIEKVVEEKLLLFNKLAYRQ
jgi:fructose-bisphosphate aldolase class II